MHSKKKQNKKATELKRPYPVGWLFAQSLQIVT